MVAVPFHSKEGGKPEKSSKKGDNTYDSFISLRKEIYLTNFTFRWKKRCPRKFQNKFAIKFHDKSVKPCTIRCPNKNVTRSPSKNVTLYLNRNAKKFPSR